MSEESALDPASIDLCAEPSSQEAFVFLYENGGNRCSRDKPRPDPTWQCPALSVGGRRAGGVDGDSVGPVGRGTHTCLPADTAWRPGSLRTTVDLEESRRDLQHSYN